MSEHDPELLRLIAHGLASEMPPESDHAAMRLRNERDREYAAMDVLDALRVAGYRIERS